MEIHRVHSCAPVLLFAKLKLHEPYFSAREGHVAQNQPMGLRFVVLLGMETKANRYLCFTGDCVY